MCCRYMRVPQQDNYDDCGVFVLMFASQLAAGNMKLDNITSERAYEFRMFITHCLLEQCLPGQVEPPEGDSWSFLDCCHSLLCS